MHYESTTSDWEVISSYYGTRLQGAFMIPLVMAHREFRPFNWCLTFKSRSWDTIVYVSNFAIIHGHQLFLWVIFLWRLTWLNSTDYGFFYELQELFLPSYIHAFRSVTVFWLPCSMIEDFVFHVTELAVMV